MKHCLFSRKIVINTENVQEEHMVKKISLVTIGIIILISIIWYVFTPASHSPVNSHLFVSEQLKNDETFQFGSFQLSWDGENQYFEITSINDATHVVFSSPKDSGFLAVG